MEREQKLVSLCLLILFVASVVVYLLLYQVRGKELINEMEQVTSGLQEVLNENQNSSLLEEESVGITGVNHSNIVETGGDANTGFGELIQTASTGELQNSQDSSVKYLSGTDLYFGVVESVDLLGLSPEYILKDGKDRYYAYFKDYPTSLKKTVQDLGGNIFSLVTEADLIKNELFGEQVDYLNLPEYKNKLVIMLIKNKGEIWYIQLPYAQYYTSKSYLKSLFY